MKVKVVKKGKFDLPRYETLGSGACDVPIELSLWDKFNEQRAKKTSLFDADNNPLFSNYENAKTIYIQPNGRCVIPTGIYMQLPKGWCVLGKDRSGLAIKTGYTVHLALLDNDYIGHVGIIVINHSDQTLEFEDGQKIMQMFLTRQTQIVWDICEDVKEFSQTERGEKGFGHTNKKK